MSLSRDDMNRRQFMIVSSVAIGSPLLLEFAHATTVAKNAEPKPTERQALKTGKIYFINRNCVGCQVCRTFCPVKAIRYGDCQNEINQQKCIQCGTCYGECPISNISETEIES